MIHFDRPPKPADFDENVRIPGERWLEGNPNPRKPPSYWTSCKSHLASGFKHLCGYSAMHMPVNGGVVEHYISVSKRPDMAYDWSNYRYAAHRINSLKGTYDERILDPFEVEDGWFEVDLASLQIVAVMDRIPEQHYGRARFTLKQLQLETGQHAVNQRGYCYSRFLHGEWNLGILNDYAPLIYRAVRSCLERVAPAEGEAAAFGEFCNGDITLSKLERETRLTVPMVKQVLPPCASPEKYL